MKQIRNKSYWAILLLVTICAAAMPANAFMVDGIEYYLNGDGTSVTVTYETFFDVSNPVYTNYSNLSGELVIPATVNDCGKTYSVTSIGDHAFAGCRGLTSVTIPNSVTSIGERAFFDCRGLTSVTISNSVRSIGAGAFWGCWCLASVTIPNSVIEIGADALGYNGLISIVVESGNPRYDSRDNCNAIIETETNTLIFGCNNTVIPSSVTSIGENAFIYRDGLTSVSIPSSVTSIGARAFYECTSLTSVHISDLAAWCNIDFESNPLSWAHNLYINGTKITNLVIPNSITAIKNNTFAGGRCLTSVTIPNSVTSIGGSAFNGCSGLTSVTIPNSVTEIGDYAFYGCRGLTSITIPNSVTLIGEWAFENCSGLTSVQISDLAAWCNIDFANYYANPLSKAHNLYLNSTKITNLVIPNSITAIKNNTFAGGRCLTSVTIPNSVTEIGYGAFSDCTGLTSVTIPTSVTEIGDYAFYGCTGMTSVTIPNSVTSIGDKAFAYCGSLTNIYSHIQNPNNVTLGTQVFYNVDKNNCILTVPGGTISLYQNADQWKDFMNIIVYIGLSVEPNVAHVRGAEHRTHELSIGMSNDEAISGVQFLMALPTGMSLATDSYGYYDVWLDDARKARNHSVSVEASSGNKYFVLISSPTNKTFSGYTGDILHMNVAIDQYHEATGDYPITLSDIILAEADETQYNAANAQSTVRMSYLVGDANADVEVDVADYVVTANYILGRSTGEYFFTDAANANYTNNTTINVTDLIAITNIALELRDKEIKPDVSDFQLVPAVTFPGNDFPLTAQVTEVSADKTLVTIAIDNDEAIAAMQLDLDLPDGVTLESATATDRASGMSATCGTSPEGKARVMLSSFGTVEIAEGSGDIIMLTLRGKAQHGDMLQLSNVVMPERSLIEHGAVGDLTLDLNDFTGVNGVTYENVSIYGSNGSVIIESPVESMAQLVRINGMSKSVKVEPGRNVYPVSVSHGDIIIVTFNGTTKKIQF